MILKNPLVYKGWGRFEREDLKVGDTDTILDLKGLFAFPCFVDWHAHLLSLGLKMEMVDLEKEDLKDVLRDQRSVLIGRGWTDPPPIDLLNCVDYPVILIRKCGHSAVLNDLAAERLGFEDNFIYENDLERIYSLFSTEDFKRAFRRAEMEFLRVGVSKVHSDDMHGVDYETLVEILKDSKIAVYEKLATSNPEPEMFKRISDRVVIGAVKIFADGSIGSRTAYMKEPYTDTGGRGMFLLDDETLESVLEFADENGVEVCIHVIGDAALEEIASHLLKHPGHRIIHAQFVPERVLNALKRTRVTVQPHFYFEDQKLLRYVRTSSMIYPFKELHDMGIDISFSSDAPVSPHDPRYVIESALKMGFTEEEAFRIYTKGSEDVCVYEKDNPLEAYPILVITSRGEMIDPKVVQ